MMEEPDREGDGAGTERRELQGAAERRGPDHAPTPRAAAPRCELCGGPVLERHCRIVCLNCGYQRDCSDP